MIPAAGSHFHDSGIAVFQISIMSLDRSMHGSGDGQSIRSPFMPSIKASVVPSPPSARGLR